MAAYSIPAALTPPKASTVYETAVAITPTDNTKIGPYACLYVGGGGDVTVVMRNGDSAGGVNPVTFKNVPAGTFLRVAVQGVNATGTDATNIVGLA